MSDDVLVSKSLTIGRCVARAREERAASLDFANDYTRPDAALLNIQRACEAALDIAYRVVRVRGLGAPTTNREAFETLVAADLLDAELAEKLDDMVGFRNVAVHRYTELDLSIVARVISSGLEDLLTFSARLLKL